MRFSISKVIPLLLPFLQMVSGEALPDLATTLPALRLVGSFSVRIEGLSTPLTYSHNIELPLAPLGRRVLDWTDVTPTSATQPQISAPLNEDNVYDAHERMIAHGDSESPHSVPDATKETNEAFGESTARTNETSDYYNSGMQLALRRPDTRSTNPLSNELSSRKKRKASRLELGVEGRATSKRTKIEEDGAEAPQLSLDRKNRRERKALERANRCKHCRHCGRQD